MQTPESPEGPPLYTPADLSENISRIMTETPGMSLETARKVADIRLTASARHGEDTFAAGHEFATRIQAAMKAGEPWARQAFEAIRARAERLPVARVLVVSDSEGQESGRPGGWPPGFLPVSLN
ncbi:hypothetical protein ACIPRL_08090 [Streptomyces sp. NPDC090085]|uniref:hypothetical protein n=1 Tax=Streptomyces sp. NPDC090085 TaxID=3365943 RepID=UPI00382F48D1